VVEIRPKIEVTGYSGLTLTKEKIDLTDEEVQESLKSLRDRMTTLAPLAVARPSEAGDVVSFDYRGLLGGKEIAGFTAKGYQAELGRGQVLAEIDSGLIGMGLEERKRISATFPADATDKNVAGKKVEIEVVLKGIKEKKIPELNDDFAKDLGDFATLEEVKARIREDLARSKEEAAKNGLRKQMIENLIEKNAFQVPEGMVRAELEEMLRQFEANLRSQGVTPEAAGVTRDDFFTKNRDAALFRVKGRLLCDAIAEKEKITVSPEEIDLQIGDMARVSGQTTVVLKKYFQENDRLSWIEETVREEKTLDFVLSRSKIKL
jgi:trigger factor